MNFFLEIKSLFSKFYSYVFLLIGGRKKELFFTQNELHYLNTKYLEQSILSEELSALISAIEHEARTPLAIIDNNVHLLEKIGKDNPEIKKSVESIYYATRRISTAVKLIHFLRMSEQSERWKRFRLEDSLRKVVKDIKYGKNCDGIYFRFDCKHHLFITAEPELLEMAVNNLINNSIEAIRNMGRKSGIIIIRSKIDKESNNIIIEIQDNGGGFPEKIRAKAIQAGFSTKGVEKGNLGLGLYIASKVVLQHSGEIKITSNKGEFTVVELHFPII